MDLFFYQIFCYNSSLGSSFKFNNSIKASLRFLPRATHPWFLELSNYILSPDLKLLLAKNYFRQAKRNNTNFVSYKKSSSEVTGLIDSSKVARVVEISGWRCTIESTSDLTFNMDKCICVSLEGFRLLSKDAHLHQSKG